MAESTNKKVTNKKKYLEPTFHFARKRIPVGTEEISEKLTISELVKSDQPLLSFPEFEKFSEKGFEKSPVRSGKNTQFSEDGDTLLASAIGYPRIDIMPQKDNEEPILLVSITPLVKVSGDKMTATLLLQPPISKKCSVRNEPLPELLKEAGILFGIDQNSLQEAQGVIAKGYTDFVDIPIAHGIQSSLGTDAYLKFAFEIGPIAGQRLEDGSIDFRERRIMIATAKDELLATKISAVPGTTGIDVLGQELEPDGGKDVEIKIKQDVKFIKESGEIRATKDGILTVVNDCEIKVCSKQVILTDIDYNTGNIDSKSCVIINGAVQPGFKVHTGGDLEIKKEVMSANILSEANVVIKGGITGKKTQIKALGDIDFKFIEQGNIECGGNVVMRKQSYYSNLLAKGAILCNEGTTIVGGETISGDSLTTSHVGSSNSKPAFLAAGVDYERLVTQRELRKKLTAQEDEIIKWLQRYGGNRKSKKIRKMEADASETKMKLLKLNLIPGTGLYSRVGDLKGTLDNTPDENDDEPQGIRIDKIFIDLKGTVLAGTVVRIGNCKLVIKKSISKRRLKLNKKMKQIIAAPIK